MSLISNLVARFTAETSGFEAGTQRVRKSLYDVNAESARTQKALLGIARGTLGFIGLGTGVYALKRSISSVVTAASDAQETANKFDAVFKNLAGDARSFAADFAKSVGRSKYEVEEWLSGLQDLFVPLGFARERAAELSKELVKIAVDVGSFKNAADADVINAFTSALVGNHEAVRKYGIIITEASLKQEALRKGFTKGYQELSNLEKVQLRYDIIQRSTADAQGDAVRTADAYAQQIKKLRGGVYDLKVEMGEQLLPAMTDLVKSINENREAWGWFFKTLADGMGEIARLPETLKAIAELAKRDDIAPRVDPNRFRGWGGFVPPGGPSTVAAPHIVSARSNQLLAEQRARAREIQEAFDAPAWAMADLKAFSGPLPGTEGGWAAAELSNTEKLIASMKRENELAAMTAQERAQTLAIEKYREAVQKDIEAGAIRGVELTVDEKAAVEDLAAEHLRLSDTAKQSTVDIAQAYARMYDQIDSKSAASFEARRRLIQAEFDEYDKVIQDKYALDMWFLDQQRKLNIERNAALGGPWQGIVAGMDELGRKALSVGEMFKEATVMGVEGFADALAKSIVRSEDLSDSLRELLLQISETMMKQALISGISGGFGAIFGTTVPAMHRGGIAGRDSSGSRLVDPSIFSRAPRLHEGLNPDEFPAILQRGERVIPAGQSASGGSQRTEALLSQVVSLLSQRQQLSLSAKIVDHRDVVTRQRMEGREGEQYVMYHSGRNG